MTDDNADLPRNGYFHQVHSIMRDLHEARSKLVKVKVKFARCRWYSRCCHRTGTLVLFEIKHLPRKMKVGSAWRFLWQICIANVMMKPNLSYTQIQCYLTRWQHTEADCWSVECQISHMLTIRRLIVCLRLIAIIMDNMQIMMKQLTGWETFLLVENILCILGIYIM